MNDATTSTLPNLELRPVINAAGTMTVLGGSIIVPSAIEAMAEIAPQFVEMYDLHKAASGVISKATGADAGTVTASSSAAIAVSIAGCMTGSDLGRIEQLPDVTGMKNQVVIQTGHLVHFGHPIEQDIHISGAVVRQVGQATDTRPYQLASAIGPDTAAALFVISHHTARSGMLSLGEFCDICHSRDVPVIVDAASEYDLKGILAAGADLVIYSGHKFLGGPTSGIVAGRKDLVRATFLQNYGIGRPMKVGKESIYGVIAALEAWGVRDHQAIRATERRILELWRDGLSAFGGITAEIIADPTGNPLERLRIRLEPGAGTSAWRLAAALAEGDQPIYVRDEFVGNGSFELDPCNQKDGQPEIVLARLQEELRKAEGAASTFGDDERSFIEARAAAAERLLQWPD
jgi:D-glucosaminate-6-phosphate ammonia-lyase